MQHYTLVLRLGLCIRLACEEAMAMGRGHMPPGKMQIQNHYTVCEGGRLLCLTHHVS